MWIVAGITCSEFYFNTQMLFCKCLQCRTERWTRKKTRHQSLITRTKVWSLNLMIRLRSVQFPCFAFSNAHQNPPSILRECLVLRSCTSQRRSRTWSWWCCWCAPPPCPATWTASTSTSRRSGRSSPPSRSVGITRTEMPPSNLGSLGKAIILRGTILRFTAAAYNKLRDL